MKQIANIFLILSLGWAAVEHSGTALIIAPQALVALQPAPEIASSSENAGLPRERPDLAQIRQAFDASGLAEANAVLVADHDAEGVPAVLRLEPASGHEALDRAVLAWGR
jgi:hypothetical protein